MRKVFEHRDFHEVGLYESILQSNGFETTIKNERVSSLAGDVPFTSVYPELWILDDDRYDEAISLLLEFRRGNRESSPSADWVCQNCGESAPGTFHSCWKCEATRPGETGS